VERPGCRLHGRSTKSQPQPLGMTHRVDLVADWQDDEKLLATHPTHRIVGSDGATHHLRGFTQHVIADKMTVHR
jgi:hypothetical protein